MKTNVHSRVLACFLAGLGVLCLLANEAATDDDGLSSRVVAINEAEAIIEPFWEPNLSGLTYWVVADGKGHGLEVKQTWASVEFSWASRPSAGPALSMTRRFALDCSAYDRLLVSVVLPVGSVLHVAAETDKGMREYVSPPAPAEIVEHVVELGGATRLESLTFDVTAATEGGGAGWFKWIGLQNAEMLSRYTARWDFSGEQWGAYIKPESYEPRFVPEYEIFLSRDELDALRKEHQAAMGKEGKSSASERAAGFRSLEPEKGIHEFAWSGGRHNAQHGRTRDESMASLHSGNEIALTGLVLKDKELLRMAARCALSLAMSEKWDDGFLARFPGSPWELRSFRRSYCSEDIAKTLDLAGEMLTEAGRTYVMRRMAEEGIGPVNYITWRFDYLFHGNQLGFVTYGRLASYLVMERVWPHVRPYTDIAYRNVLEMFDNVILADGGCLEPPSYVASTLSRGCDMLEMYARARNEAPRRLVPRSLERTGDYACVIASTVPEADVIPYGDSEPLLRGDALFRLSDLAPKSYWTALLRKRLAREEGTSFTLAQRRIVDSLPKKTPALPAFVSLSEVGHMASNRFVQASDGRRLPVKILLIGNRAGDTHDHEHEDRGSFVLEFAGETFAMDPGICDYEDPLQTFLKQCQYHNMLVPVVEGERPSPACPIRVAVKPVGHGNRTSFHAAMTLTSGWERFYKTWKRSWDSPSPEQLTIEDEYDLVKGDAVEFYLQTKCPCRVEGQRVMVQGKEGLLQLDAPSECAIRVDTLPSPGNEIQNRVVVRRVGRCGSLRIDMRLQPN